MPTKTAIDIDGSEAVTTALLELLNRFPGLKQDEKFLFSTVPEDGGIGFFPTSGAVYLQNGEDIMGHVKQTVQYPFSVVYRVGAKTESQRLRIKEFLDTLGKWLERQPVTVNQSVCRQSGNPVNQPDESRPPQRGLSGRHGGLGNFRRVELQERI